MAWWYSIPIRSHVYTYKQECIPVGCVGREEVVVSAQGMGVSAQEGVGVSAQEGVGVSAQEGGVCPGGCLADTSSVNRMTDVCENITLQQLRCGR